MLRTYVMILYNWLILWQNALYLYLSRSRMCLILQETSCSSLVLKPWRLDQETSEEKLFIKVGQIAQHLRTDSSTATRWLLDRSRKLLSPRQLPDNCIYRGLKLNTSSTPLDRLRLWEFRFLDLIFGPGLCICIGFLFSQP